AKTFVEKKPKQTNKKDRCDQNDSETAEGNLLLFVESAKCVKNVARNRLRVGEFLFHFANSRAKVAAADARGHRNHAFEIVAHDFGLAAQRNERGHTFQRK